MLFLAVGEKKIFKWTEVTNVKIHWTLSATDECIFIRVCQRVSNRISCTRCNLE